MNETPFTKLDGLIDLEVLCQSERAEPSNRASLPENLHFIWVGSDPSPSVIRRIASWASQNPFLRVFLWNEAALYALADSEPNGQVGRLLRAANNPAVVSDVGRFAILRRFGGLYLDTDMEACRPLDGLLNHPSGFVARESRWLLVASAIGLPRDSFFGDAALSIMEKATLGDVESLDNFMSGPPLITELMKAMRRRSLPAPSVLPEWTFFPDNPFRFPRHARSSVPPYGVHLFDHSWGAGSELAAVRRLVRALLQPILPRDVAIGARRGVQLNLRQLAAEELSPGGRA